MPDWQEVDESQLIKRAKDGEVEAFGELYERHLQPVFRFIYSRMNNRLDAEDLAEEVFIRVWRSLPNFEDQGVPFIAFLMRVARNALIDFHRRPVHSQPPVYLEENIVSDPQPDPGDLVLDNLEHQELKKTLAQLKEDYRVVLVLRYLSELSPDEIAQVMGRSSGAVRVLQHRALTALRNLLEESRDH